ncbi:hypothetical protein GCM10007047_23820 [Cerasicoccus arenae]|uniref:Uncharacterized protein n=1 Tax=Cerasicoccus arenae TaxID=424488 RepID=A0A8J3GES5_9BACT|nr:hypothetical protein GCM10007047_23820 [Cerasicoccus arenae]
MSSNVIISANHFHPIIGQSIVFYATNDPNGASETRTVVAGERFGVSDVWVGVLNAPLPASYEPLAFTTDNINSAIQFNFSSHHDATAFLVGISSTSPDVALDMAVGQNILTDWYSNITVNGAGGYSATGNAIRAFQDQSGDPNFIAYEAYLQDHDSGAPMIRDVNGELTIIGLNWFIHNDLTALGTRNYSAFSYVGNFATEIQAVIDAFAGLNLSKEYGTWIGTSFDGETDLTLMTPSYDYDNDGMTNYEEYALVSDPIAYDHATETTVDTIDAAGTIYTEITVQLREADNYIGYTVMTGSDLDGWNTTTLAYTGSWGTGNAGVATVTAATDHGSTWTVTVRDAVPITSGAPRFMRIGY